jgi:parallel beta-helix repeat protein
MRSLVNRFAWIVAVVLALALIAVVARGALAGPLDPPGPPVSSPGGIDGRIPLSQADCCPIVIDQPGSYYLTEDIFGVNGQDGIRIMVSHVTLDLNGFDLDGVPGSGDGIDDGGVSRFRLTVRNGRIENWGGSGINLASSQQVIIGDVTVAGNGSRGVHVGSQSRISDCTVFSNGGVGIELESVGNTVRECYVAANDAQGIRVDGTQARIEGNHVRGNGFGCCTGIYLNGADNIAFDNTTETNGNYGIWISGTGNTVFNNVSHGDTNGGYNNVCGVPCDIGPVHSVGSAGSAAWANIQN